MFWESLSDGLDDKCRGRSWSFTLYTSLGGEEASFQATLPFVKDAGLFLELQQRLVTGPWILTVPSVSRSISLPQTNQLPVLDVSEMDDG